MFGQQGLIDEAAEYLTDAGAPESTVNSVTSALESAQGQRGTAVGAFVIGLVISLNGASGAFAAAGRALNKIWRVEEGRGFVHRKLHDVGWTLVVLVMALVTFVLLFLGGGLADDIFDAIGLGSEFGTVWGIVRWPLALLGVMTIYAILYYSAPNVDVPRFRWLTPGRCSASW